MGGATGGGGVVLPSTKGGHYHKICLLLWNFLKESCVSGFLCVIYAFIFIHLFFRVSFWFVTDLFIIIQKSKCWSFDGWAYTVKSE